MILACPLGETILRDWLNRIDQPQSNSDPQIIAPPGDALQPATTASYKIFRDPHTSVVLPQHHLNSVLVTKCRPPKHNGGLRFGYHPANTSPLR
ncbi:hypothetical protein Pla52n_66290 [Stieleria varia]|uniref:Uncharacterized protein n=2 Tax=Stieleria varia TaxID=2528005 RepID=A0A5C5ZW15_9BACT|nr:hypothetical protein Pla52n_66290 [Stieleria varia]